MIAGRRMFQVGPSTYTYEPGINGFYVVEHWWQMRSDGEQEDVQERVSGPHTLVRAEQRVHELQARLPCHA